MGSGVTIRPSGPRSTRLAPPNTAGATLSGWPSSSLQSSTSPAASSASSSSAAAAAAPATVAAAEEPSPRAMGMSDSATSARPAGTSCPARRQAAAKPRYSRSASGAVSRAQSVPPRSITTGFPPRVAWAVTWSQRPTATPTQSNPAPCAWRLPGAVPDAVRDLVVQAPEPPLDCDVVFSSLPSDVAGSVETRFARAGYRVVTNSSPHRMDDAVPLLIPEVNPDQLALLDACKATGGGFIVANPNCSTVMIALALAPLADRFGVAAVAVTTLQAISGAGYPGVASLDITDNVVPFIPEEEEKIERETRKILGSLEAGRVTPARFAVSAQCHRVNVVDGHMAAVRVKLDRAAEPAELREAFASFTGVPQELRLASAPERPILVRDEPDRPQPRLDRDAGGGMSISVGRIARA